LNDYFESRRTLVESRLERLADEAAAPNILRDPLTKAMRSRGKRVRALLTIAVGEAMGMKAERLVDAATAFELIHACSLVLDDLPAMDDAELRRGEPALHRAFGEDLAILSAVALLNCAYGLVAANHAATSPRRWPLPAVIDRVVAAVGWDGTIGGEAVDLHSEGRALDFQTLEYIHSRKTGALFVAAAAVGAMLSNASEGLLSSVEAYAKNLGLAFQITDDILDVTSDQETLGKDTGKDEGKLTFVRLAGLDGARQLNHELVETSLAAIAPLGSSASRLRQLAEMVRDRTR
jgi:geranylgeranyl diphosphate synthase type II